VKVGTSRLIFTMATLALYLSAPFEVIPEGASADLQGSRLSGRSGITGSSHHPPLLLSDCDSVERIFSACITPEYGLSL